MFNKIKNIIKSMSIGKKIYSSLWLLWVVLLATLIGMFAGLKDKMSQSTPPATGLTIKTNSENALTYVKDNAELNRDFADQQANYFVKNIEASQAKDPEIFTAIKNALTNEGKWQDAWNDYSLTQLLAVIYNLRDADGQLDEATIKTVRTIVWENTVYEVITAAKMHENYRTLYDSKVAYTTETTNGERMYLFPIWTPNTADPSQSAFIYKPVLEAGEWVTTLTDEAKKTINATASIGFLFLVVMISAVGTTVYVSVKDKKAQGGNK